MSKRAVLPAAIAELARERAQHQETNDLAEAIVAAQEREIGIMEKHAAGEHYG